MRFVTKGLPHDSPEFQARANRPRSERGPNLARYHEQQREDERQAQSADDQPPAG